MGHSMPNHRHHQNKSSHEHDKHAFAKATEDKHAGHSVAMFRDKFWISLILTLPVLAYSASIQRWLHFNPPDFNGSEYVPFVLSTVIFLYGGLVFLKGAWSELK